MNILNLNESELLNLILTYTKSNEFISKFGLKTLENITIQSIVNKKIIVDTTLDDNVFYFALCNGSFASIDYTASPYVPVCSVELLPLVGPSQIVSYLPNNELLLFNKVLLTDTSLNILGYLITIN